MGHPFRKTTPYKQRDTELFILKCERQEKGQKLEKVLDSTSFYKTKKCHPSLDEQHF
jgi:hypothetical protein